MAAKWEYFVARFRETQTGWTWMSSHLSGKGFEDDLDYLGADGWELVASTDELNDGRSIGNEYIFKRQK